MALLLAAAAVVAWRLPQELLVWNGPDALFEPWRWWTAATVHRSGLHLAVNLIGCVVVGAFGLAARVPDRACWAWFAAWPLTHVALVVRPELINYGGLSGVLHAGVAIAAFHLARREQGQRRAIGWAVLVGLTLKVIFERPWGPVLVASPDWGFLVAPWAHGAGALIGLAGAALIDTFAPSPRVAAA
ncbi:MAG TPA: rhombosortase [Burkholderiaceae bacterium]|nr:rhombosortase [Burkholderiaceae bacterium]